MPSKSKKVAPEPKAKYAVNGRVFVISYHKEIPEELIECKVYAVRSRKTSTWEWGKAIGTSVEFSYDLSMANGLAQNFDEGKIYPSYFEAAKVFAKPFLTLLK